MEDKKNYFKVGLTVFIAAVLLLTMLYAVSDMRFFQDNFEYYIVFDFVSGLSQGAPVYIAGVEKGKVEDLNYDEINGELKVKVRIAVPEDIKIYKESKAHINTLGLMGEKYIEIIMKKSDNYIKPGEIILGVNPVRTDEMLSRTNEILNEFRNSLRSLNEIIDHTETKDHIVATLENLASATKNLNSILKAVDKEKDSVFRDVNKQIARQSENLEKIMKNLDISSKNLNAAMADFRDFSGDLKEISSSSKENIKTATSNLNEFSKRSVKISEDFQIFIDKINSDTSSLSYILTDDKIGRNILEATENLKEMSEEVKAKPWIIFKR